MTTRTVAAIAVIAALLCSAACGSSSDDPQPTPTPRPGTFAGVVSETGVATPIADATIMLMQTASLKFMAVGDTFETTSGADGTYSIEVPAGTYDIWAYKGTTEFDDFAQTGLEVAAGGTNNQNVVLAPAATYTGSAACAGCHGDIHDQFVQSGHPYKLNKVTGGVAPSYPFTDLTGVEARIEDDGMDITDGLADPNALLTDNTLGLAPNATTWNDITYVIGGYFWKARFIDTSGHIITGSSVQYNFATDGMVGYHNNEVDKVYNCGNCHTTGWRHFDATDNPMRQDGLAGMDGTFEEQGIGCEACHGAGSRHVALPSTNNITRLATPRTPQDYAHGRMGWGVAAACGDCHTRDGEDDYPTFESAFNVARVDAGLSRIEMGGRIAASSGLVKHHEQYDELLGIDPDTLETTRSTAFMSAHGNCGTCHVMDGDGLGGAHGSTVNQGNVAYTGDDGVQGTNADCQVCHPLNDPGLRTGGMQTLNCTDCHMPKMAKSAVAVALPNGVIVGDVSSHVFGIDVGTAANQFTSDGKFAYPAVTVDWACRTCHGNGGLFDVGASDTYVFHNNK